MTHPDTKPEALLRLTASAWKNGEAVCGNYMPTPVMLEMAADTIESLRTQLAAAQTLAAERLEQMTADRAQALRWRDEADALRADARRWREMRRVFHVTENIGRTTGMPATKLSCHWHGWATGDHADVTGCVDALIAERAAIDAALTATIAAMKEGE